MQKSVNDQKIESSNQSCVSLYDSGTIFLQINFAGSHGKNNYCPCPKFSFWVLTWVVWKEWLHSLKQVSHCQQWLPRTQKCPLFALACLNCQNCARALPQELCPLISFCNSLWEWYFISGRETFFLYQEWLVDRKLNIELKYFILEDQHFDIGFRIDYSYCIASYSRSSELNDHQVSDTLSWIVKNTQK